MSQTVIASSVITSATANCLIVFGALPALQALGEAAADTVKDITYATLAFGAAIITITLDDGGE